MEEYRKYSSSAYRGTAVRRAPRRSAINLYLTLSTVLISAIMALLLVNVFCNLRQQKITVEGANLYSAEQVEQVGGVIQGQNLVRLNTDFIENRIRSGLVYVDEVSVEKKYPDGLNIRITEAQQAAQIFDDGVYYLLSGSGRLLEASYDRDPSLPLINGFELKGKTAGAQAQSKDEQKTRIIADIFSGIHEYGFDKVDTIDVSDRTDITLTYDSRIDIKLGSSVDLPLKLSNIKAVLDSGKLPDGFEGTLTIFSQGKEISALPKPTDTPKPSAPTSSQDDTSSEDSSQQAWTDSYTDTNTDYGYSDSYTDYGYGDTYTDYGYGDTYTDYGYGDTYTDYGYGDTYTDYGYGDTYTDYGYSDTYTDYGYDDTYTDNGYGETYGDYGY